MRGLADLLLESLIIDSYLGMDMECIAFAGLELGELQALFCSALLRKLCSAVVLSDR